MADRPLLKLRLPDGRPATLLLGAASTVLSVEDRLVSSWDLAGRPYALVREDGTYRRGLDGGLLHKREATSREPRIRRRLSAEQGTPVVEAARVEAAAALAALADGHPTAGETDTEAARRLSRVAAQDAPALAADADRFLARCGPVGILPPDQYLSLVVRITEGCSWNACTFCRLYRDVPFRRKTPDELRAHLVALSEYFGDSLVLRRSVFLGDANAACLAHEQLLPLLDVVAGQWPGRPLFCFVDAWTGERKPASSWRRYAERGLERVYVGLETGDPGLLAWLEKPGAPADAVSLVRALHEAGVAAGVIVLLGAGGSRFSDAHVARTAEVLASMELGTGDLLYFSEMVDEPSLAYGRRAAGAADLQPLSSAEAARQRDRILDALPARRGSAPRVATYDIREFVY